MGRRNRERRERIVAGVEESLSAADRERVAKVAGNPIGRRVLAAASRKGVVDELSGGSVGDQVGRLDGLVGAGALPARKLKSAIKAKAPKEMDTAIRKFQKQGREITVDSLCYEVKTEPGFLAMCERVGLSLEWFEDLARERMAAKGVG